MSRKSRKTDQNAPVAAVKAQPFFKTAVYARLSSEDKEALSLENQILMVQRYIEQNPDLRLCGVFSDNGLTGTNFNRPAFENLMDEIRCGKINCIVVKDLSRFGRDYVEAGNFLEVIFPRLGIRFISISDNYDSFDPRCQGEGMCIALKNMINAFYAKDISTKIRSAYAVKRKKGEFTGKCSPFGYLKSPENKNKLIIDNESADIVRMIYKLKLDGMSVHQITRHLSEQAIPNPGHYRYIKGIHKEERYKNPQYWDYSTVQAILESKEYLGHLEMGKTTVIDGKAKDVPREDWVVVENTHAPIISQDEFDAVAEQFRQEKMKRNDYDKHSREELPENVLEGLIFCSDCGRTYRRIPNTMRDKVTYRLTYICVHCNKSNPKYKYKHFKQKDLYHAVYTIIRQQIDTCIDVSRKIGEINASQNIKKRGNVIDGEIQRIQKRLDRFPIIKMNLYTDLQEEVINESEYKLLSRKYEDERLSLLAEFNQYQAEKEKQQPQFVNGNKWVSALERFITVKELTREMVLALVDRIEVSGYLEIEIKFRYQDEYKRLAEFIKESEGCLNE